MAQMQRLAPGLSFQLRYSERKVALNDLLAGASTSRWALPKPTAKATRRSTK